MIFSACRLKLKLSNAQILCPKKHNLKVIKIKDSDGAVLYCKKCELFYPFPRIDDMIKKLSEVKQ